MPDGSFRSFLRVSNLRSWLGIELIAVSATDKLVAILGGGVSILLLMAFSWWALPNAGATAVVASMGASAVLLFAMPHGPLSQPWPVMVGHGVSAVIGVACAHSIASPPWAAACAVGLAIGAMHLLKCIHPPGGATAFTAVMGGESIRQLGFGFALFPVLSNAVLMVLLAVLINAAFHWRRYPAVAARVSPPLPPTPDPDAITPPTHKELIAALKTLDSFVDVREEDLLQLVKILNQRSTQRPATQPKNFHLATPAPRGSRPSANRVSAGSLHPKHRSTEYPDR